jgi:hypothetical protein
VRFLGWRGGIAVRVFTDDARSAGDHLGAAGAAIVRELQRLELVLNMIKTIEVERDAIVSAGKSATHANAKKIRDLIKLKSIGPEIISLRPADESGELGEFEAASSARISGADLAA